VRLIASLQLHSDQLQTFSTIEYEVEQRNLKLFCKLTVSKSVERRQERPETATDCLGVC